MNTTLTHVAKSPLITRRLLTENGLIPNNGKLPLLVYLQALEVPTNGGANVIEEIIKSNHWGGTWRDGIFNYHHYHSTAHEVLLVFKGAATVQFGGESGFTQELNVGDAVLIPAGVAHKNLRGTPDFRVVGAYPAGQKWDMNYGNPGERPKTDENIRRVPLPSADPLYGAAGPLLDHWKK